MAEGITRKEQIFGVKSRTIQVYNPTGAVMAERIPEFSPRIDTFDGKRIGLLWNSKPNGNHYLNRVAELVSQRFPSAKVTKFYETHPVETANPDKKSDAAIALMAQNADVVIAAQGD